MEWWQNALLSFGEKGEGITDTTKWSCIICKDSEFSSQAAVKTHLRDHKLEEFQSLKFEVKVKGLREDAWDTLSESVINVSIDNSKETIEDKDTAFPKVERNSEYLRNSEASNNHIKELGNIETIEEPEVCEGSFMNMDEFDASHSAVVLVQGKNKQDCSGAVEYEKSSSKGMPSEKASPTFGGGVEVNSQDVAKMQKDTAQQEEIEKSDEKREEKIRNKDDELLAMKSERSDIGQGVSEGVKVIKTNNVVIGRTLAVELDMPNPLFQSTPFTRRGTRVRKRISLDDFVSNGYPCRKDNSFGNYGSKSIKKAKLELEERGGEDSGKMSIKEDNTEDLPTQSSPKVSSGQTPPRKRGRPRKTQSEARVGDNVACLSVKKEVTLNDDDTTSNGKSKDKQAELVCDKQTSSEVEDMSDTDRSSCSTNITGNSVMVNMNGKSLCTGRQEDEPVGMEGNTVIKQEETSSSTQLLDGCGRGADEKEKDAIEVLMNCLNKSVRHAKSTQIKQNQANHLHSSSKTSTPKPKKPRKGKTTVNVCIKKSERLVFGCDLCGLESTEHQGYHRHLLIHSDMTPVRCWYCDKTIDVNTVSETSHEFTCEVCEETFTQNSQLAVHIKDTGHHFTSKNFSSVIDLDHTCFICSLSLASAEELDVHLKCVHVDLLCSKSQEEIDVLKQSVKPVKPALSDLQDFVCHICQWKSNRHFNFHRHMLTHTLGKNYKCTHCYKVISANSSKTGYGQTIHRCEDCDQIFHTKLKYTTHRFEVHSETSKGTRQCRICGFVARSKKDISKHHMMAHGTEKFDTDQVHIIDDKRSNKKGTKTMTVCDLCGFASDRKDSVEKHRLTHIPPEQRDIFKCCFCEFSSYVMSSLNMHVSTKHREKKASVKLMYKCDLCLVYRCEDKSDLLLHKTKCISLFEEHISTVDRPSETIPVGATPAGATPAEVDISVQEKQETQDGCVEETEVETEKATEKTDLETSGYTNSSQTKRRKNCDLGTEVRFVCDLCELVFTRPWNLKRHKEMAHDREKYQCEVCDYATKNLRYLTRHYDVLHSLAPPDGLRPVKEDPFEEKERQNRRNLTIRPVTVKKPGRLNSEEKVSCEYCEMEVTESTLKAHLNRKHMNMYRCNFQECTFSTTVLDEIRAHIVHNHLQDHTVSALEVLNDLCSKPLTIPDPSSSAHPTDLAVLMCVGCWYRTSTIEDMITHKAPCLESCGSAVLKLGQAHVLSECSHCSFHPNSLQESLQHQIRGCIGKDLYHINELIEESQQTVYQFMDASSIGTAALTADNITPSLYPGNFINHSGDQNQIDTCNLPSYTEAVSQKITSDCAPKLQGNKVVQSVRQEITHSKSMEEVDDSYNSHNDTLRDSDNGEPGFDESILKKSMEVNFNTVPYATDMQFKLSENCRNKTDAVILSTDAGFAGKPDFMQHYGELINENAEIMEGNVIKQDTLVVQSSIEASSQRAYNTDFVRRLFEETPKETRGPQKHLEEAFHTYEDIQKLSQDSGNKSSSPLQQEKETESESREAMDRESESETFFRVTSHGVETDSYENSGLVGEGAMLDSSVYSSSVKTDTLANYDDDSNIASHSSDASVLLEGVQDGAANNQRVIVVDKKEDNLTFITVPNGENEISFEIRGQLNVNAEGELPSNLYSLISQVLEKQSTGDQSTDVVYCDIIVDNDD